ncbi:MAG: urate hydroxylase PuuD [Blastocatellia bacterium]|nr:urate hydroxylase PuuD [Blastocatellia bacterium]
MLPALIFDLPMLFAQTVLVALQDIKILWPTSWETHIEMILRWLHFLAGITWIGHLYFFNFVNANVMKALDGPTKGKVIPQLMPRALWWFRWGAAITVLAGVIYYIIILHSEPNTWPTFFKWLVVVLVIFAIIYGLLQPLSGALNNGWILAVIVALLMIIMAIVLLMIIGGEGPTRAGTVQPPSSRSMSIAIGGGMGVIMMLNVWGIIWPHQKRIIAWTYNNAENGTEIPAESAKLARRAFLASRMNTWLSIPMLFFMGAAQHFTLFVNK